jgi:hypothetical protein
VFDSLRHSLQKMSKKDRYCCLLFDETSISENVRFNHKFDCIEGFEDLGSLGRTCNIANHALLFMARGLHRKLKWPVAYYLSRGSNKAELLVQFLNKFLGAWCMSQCWTACCCPCLWHGYQQCQGPETVGFNHKKVILLV